FDRIRVVDTSGACGEQPKMTIHRVLVERDQQIKSITHIGDSFRACAYRQESVATANDRLVGVVRIQVQAATTKYFCEDIAGCGNALSRRASDTNSKGPLHGNLLSGIRSSDVAFQFLNGLCLSGDNPFDQITD